MTEPSDEPQTLTMTSDEFVRYVAMAADQVDRKRGKRTFIVGFVAGLLASSLIALPVVFFTAKANCNAIGSLAQTAEERFVEEKAANKLFLKQSKDRLGLSDAAFQKLIHDVQTRQQREIDATRRVAHRSCTLI